MRLILLSGLFIVLYKVDLTSSLWNISLRVIIPMEAIADQWFHVVLFIMMVLIFEYADKIYSILSISAFLWSSVQDGSNFRDFWICGGNRKMWPLEKKTYWESDTSCLILIATISSEFSSTLNQSIWKSRRTCTSDLFSQRCRVDPLISRVFQLYIQYLLLS